MAQSGYPQPNRRGASGSDDALVVRRVTAGDAAHLRAARLRALAEAPFAFSSRLEDEAAEPESFWAAKALESDRGEAGAIFIALLGAGEDEVGMAGAYPHIDLHDAVRLWGLWVADSARGRGIAPRLLDLVCEWSRARGAATVSLGVFDGPRSEPARRLYHRYGFESTGDVHPPRNSQQPFLVHELLLTL